MAVINHKSIQRSITPPGVYSKLFILLCLLLTVFTVNAQEPGTPVAGEGTDLDYRLNPGDKISVSVFNHEDLSGELVVDGNGRIFLPLIGQVQASGLTSTELESELVSRFRPDYLVNPKISVQVQMFRPYYMMGEVKSQGPFEFTAGMTYLEAIARAGGYTYRAKKDVVYVVHAGDTPDEVRLEVNEKVQPGDVIRVAERIF